MKNVFAFKKWFRVAMLMSSLLACGSALAQAAGEVVHLSGTLSVQRADGAMLVLGQKSEVRTGDVLTTQKDSYAQINFTDGSAATMRPVRRSPRNAVLITAAHSGMVKPSTAA